MVCTPIIFGNYIDDSLDIREGIIYIPLIGKGETDMNEEIKATLDRMHECAAESFFAAERFGKGSPQHLLQHAVYSDAAKHYEAICKDAGRDPYATYSED